MLCDILSKMKNLTRFWFYHEKFPNTDQLKGIFENELGMKALRQGETCTRYKKDEKIEFGEKLINIVEGFLKNSID